MEWMGGWMALRHSAAARLQDIIVGFAHGGGTEFPRDYTTRRVSRSLASDALSEGQGQYSKPLWPEVLLLLLLMLLLLLLLFPLLHALPRATAQANGGAE